ncbi:hypothetical protein AB0I77_05675 [Streptomyces sp. NPDC050619]|uniref:RNA polymerase sigma factor n=1 Tax=Streptomyces sp. NPDC050619 TaxID=3157214 RepID=UPI0034458C4E
MLEQELARAREVRFEALARAVAEPLNRYLVRRADADAVDDILAETMLVLWRRLEDVPGLGEGPPVDADEVLPWCYGVARGCLSNARRAQGRRLRLVERLTRTAPPPDLGEADHTELHPARHRDRSPPPPPDARCGSRRPAGRGRHQLGSHAER